MNKILTLAIFALITSLSCSKGSSSTACDFIGVWCFNTPINGVCGTPSSLEFRSNGEFLYAGTGLHRWESEDCKRVNIINEPTDLKTQEFNIMSITSSTMMISIGSSTAVEMYRIQ